MPRDMNTDQTLRDLLRRANAMATEAGTRNVENDDAVGEHRDKLESLTVEWEEVAEAVRRVIERGPLIEQREQELSARATTAQVEFARLAAMRLLDLATERECRLAKRAADGVLDELVEVQAGKQYLLAHHDSWRSQLQDIGEVLFAVRQDLKDATVEARLRGHPPPDMKTAAGR